MCRKVQARQTDLDLSVESFGQPPPGMRFLQTATSGEIRHPIEVLRGLFGQFGVRLEDERVAQQAVKEQMSGSVGKGSYPLAYRGTGRPLAVQLSHQAPPAQASEEIERDHVLQQRDDKVAVRMQKVGQQAVGPTTDLAAHALDRDAIVGFLGKGAAFVTAPADQRIHRPAVGMRTTVRNCKNAVTGTGDLDVCLDGTSEMLYNDHVVGTPPPVVGPASFEPRREVSSFLPGFALLSPSVLFRQVRSLPHGVDALSLSINHCDREWSGS